MKRILIILFVSILGLPGIAQDNDATKYAATITQDDLRELLTIISSDALEGRETGTRGQKMAAAFIVEEFKRIGLQPVVPTASGNSYLQKFKLENYAKEGIYLKNENVKFNLQDNILFTGKRGMMEPQTSELIFIGQNQSNFSGLNIKGKIVLMAAVNSNRKAHEKWAIEAYSLGAEMVIFVPFNSNDEFKKFRRSEGRNYARTRYAFEQKEVEGITNGYFLVSPKIAGEILADEDNSILELLDKDVSGKRIRKINDRKLTLTYYTSLPTATIASENVLGYLEGTDKKEELVVVTAHYDHIGRRGGEINNGADDDGSGTSAVIELAEAFAQAKAEGHGPRRSMLFMTVTGEEKGLIGSQYYTNNPIFPLANTVVDLNMDMIGRHDDAHEDNKNFVYLVGSDRLSSELHELSEKANETFTHLTLDYTYNDENHPDRIYYRSDHWNFAKHNVPIIFYFNGVHADYHQPTDTIDKIEFDMLQKRAQLVFYTAWVVANRDQRPMVDEVKEVEIQPKK